MTSTTRRIRVGSEAPTAADVLEYAVELIEAYGWNNTGRSADGVDVDYVESSEQQGFTLHDSIGEACTRLSRAVGQTPSKNWAVTTIEGQAEDLRVSAQGFVNEVLSEDYPGKSDYVFNDEAQTADEVTTVLRQAHEKAEAAK